MDHKIDARDFELLEADKFTFAVLTRILQVPCSLVLTDHKGLILCHSEPFYPVWLWTPNGTSNIEKEAAWNTCVEVRPLCEGYRYNMKPELAEYFIKRAKQQGMEARIITNMYAYYCPAPIEPEYPTDGHFYPCTENDIEEAIALIKCFQEEIGEKNGCSSNPPQGHSIYQRQGVLFMEKFAGAYRCLLLIEKGQGHGICR